MRTLAACSVVVMVLVGCESAEEKAAKRLEAARVDAAQRRAKTALVKTTATNLRPAPAELVVRVSSMGLEIEDVALANGLVDGGVGPRALDRFKQPGTAGWLELPLLEAALRECTDAALARAAAAHPRGFVEVPELSLDVAPETPALRVAQVLVTIEYVGRQWQPRVTLAGPVALESVWVETTRPNEFSETCGHEEVMPSSESCIVPRVRLGPGGAQVLARAGTARCFVGDFLREPEDHTWNEGPFLPVDGGCVLDAPAALVKEVAALGPGCRHTLVELASNELPWARVGGLIATLAAEEPDRTFVLTTPWQKGLVSCANATRPAQWKRFVRGTPRPTGGLLRALLGDGGL